MFKKKKLDYASFAMPTAEELGKYGIKELSYEELLQVNGGKRKSCSSSRSSGSGSSSSKGSSSASSSSSFDSCGSYATRSSYNEKKIASNGSSSGASKKRFWRCRGKGGSANKGAFASGAVSDYTVQKGDTLSAIVSKRYPNASAQELRQRIKEAAKASDIKNPDLIYPGQKIIFEGGKTTPKRVYKSFSLQDTVLNFIRMKVQEKPAKSYTAGYVIDEQAVRGAGHAWWFVSRGDGKYSLFEVTNFPKEVTGPQKKYIGTDKREGEVLSSKPLIFPTPGTANRINYDSQAGVLRTDFTTREDMMKYLTSVGDYEGFDKIIEFDITEEQSKAILDRSVAYAEQYAGYEPKTSCGVSGREILTSSGAGIGYADGKFLQAAANTLIPLSPLGAVTAAAVYAGRAAFNTMPNTIGWGLQLANTCTVTEF